MMETFNFSTRITLIRDKLDNLSCRLKDKIKK